MRPELDLAFLSSSSSRASSFSSSSSSIGSFILPRYFACGTMFYEVSMSEKLSLGSSLSINLDRSSENFDFLKEKLEEEPSEK